MPKVNRNQSLANSKQNGTSKKQAVKVFRAYVRAANGGKTRMGRLIAGATKIAATAVPGIGGMVANALQPLTVKATQSQDYVKQLPAFEQNTADMANTIGGAVLGAVNQPTELIKQTPVVLMSTPAPIAEVATPPVKEQSLGQTSNTQKVVAESNNIGSGGGVGMGADDEQPTESRQSFVPTTDSKTMMPTTTKNKNKIYWIVFGSLLAVVILVVIVKSIQKK